jgi:hypothetical protein
MLKESISKVLMYFLLITASATSSAQPHEMSLGFSIDYVFKPNEPQDLVNNFFFTIEANCKVKSTDESDDLLAKMLNGSSTVNSNKLNLGDEIKVTVRNNDILHIVAPSGAKVRLTNLGLTEFIANCYPA